MTAAFMLDTDSVSFALRGRGRVAQRILQYAPSRLCISAITLAELRFGASRRGSRKLHDLIDAFTGDVAVIPFDDAAALQFGALAADLHARGSAIGDYDVLIAAHAIALDVTLVTNNVKHFDRVRGLRVENWL